MAGELEAVRRRIRRLSHLAGTQEVMRANAALREVWESGSRPSHVLVRRALLAAASTDAPPPLYTTLLNPRGIALRFYLIALFEAQCRLRRGKPWESQRPLEGRRGWTNFVAVDAAYSSVTETYLPETKQQRDTQSSRLRQVQGALRTLRGTDDLDVSEDRLPRALVTLPRKGKRRAFDYGAFSLMRETGRGPAHTPEVYAVPQAGISIPAGFFLNGWAQVLTPAEVATWLVLRTLRYDHPDQHDESGVYLYANRREGEFGLKRDSYQDSCRTLWHFGLLQLPGVDTFEALFADRSTADPYEPHRFQLADGGVAKNAVDKITKELVLRHRNLGNRADTKTA
ncbi:hypothetical protein OG458_42820 (plasmid) [Streptomyces sp. NBC_01281]|uniref:hypothetical protein n=1 Tax=Streptomyces sp. NBC_01281 TaxID=2903811 RepID=UPI002E12B63D|nr:hypothetical protein OG458_42820 [Streptomyces sp. NBC_01281]